MLMMLGVGPEAWVVEPWAAQEGVEGAGDPIHLMRKVVVEEEDKCPQHL